MRYKEYQKNKVKKQSSVDVDPLWGIWCWCWCWYRHIILPPYKGSTKCVMSKPLSKEIQKKSTILWAYFLMHFHPQYMEGIYITLLLWDVLIIQNKNLGKNNLDEIRTIIIKYLPRSTSNIVRGIYIIYDCLFLPLFLLQHLFDEFIDFFSPISIILSLF